MQGVRLGALLYSAKNHDARETHVPTVSLKTFFDLHCKLSRGREDKASDVLFLAMHFMCSE